MTPTLTRADLLSAFWLVVTIALFLGARRLHARWPRTWLTPIITVPVAIISLTLLTHTTYDQYRAWSRGLVWLLGPATVAFALPIYQHRHLMARLPWTMVAATLTGIVVALGSTWLCVWAFDLPVVWWHTLMPRSVSTPFALPISVQLGGVGDLTVLSVLVTGLIGMVWGPGLLACLGWDDPVTCGMALGASAHGIGTARAYQLSTMHGMLSSLTMIFSGIGLSLIAPWLAHV